MVAPYNVEFLTGTILRWQKLLEDDNCKKIIIDSCSWLVSSSRCNIFAFVIMPNHIHLLWRISSGFSRDQVQTAFFSYTAHTFQKYLRQKDKKMLDLHYVNDADRKYQFWERSHAVKECWSKDFIQQKLNYIHTNPCEPHWNLVQLMEDYQWSSASFYSAGDLRYSWLTHITE